MDKNKTQQKPPFLNKKNSILFLIGIVLTALLYTVQEYSYFFRASILDRLQEVPAFDGTVFPLKNTLNWIKLTSGEYQTFKTGDFTYTTAGEKNISLGEYNAGALCANDPTKLTWSGKDLTLRNQFLTYVTVYMGQYTSGVKTACENTGSHPAVDIRSARGTPVVAIANGIVVKMKEDANNGKMVCIAHPNVPSLENADTKKTYTSCYLHLDSIESSVSEGKIMNKGNQIGTVGNTGLATTYHLHFQLDNDDAPWHPYWPFTSTEAKTAGLSFFEAVDIGLGKENGLKNTVNPMKWVQKYLNYTATASDGGNNTENKNMNNGNTLSQNANKNSTANIHNANLNKNSSVLNTNNNAVVQTNQNSKTNNEFFSDVPASSRYYKAIKYLKDMGAIGGYEDGTFKLDKGVNRVEALKMLLEAFKIQLEASEVASFPDIEKQSWYYPYLNTAVLNAYVKGYPDGMFNPNNGIIRAEFAKILIEVAGDPSELNNVQFACKDVKPTEWYLKYADYFCRKDLLDFESDKFLPSDKVTRGEVALAIYRLLVLK